RWRGSRQEPAPDHVRTVTAHPRAGLLRGWLGGRPQPTSGTAVPVRLTCSSSRREPRRDRSRRSNGPLLPLNGPRSRPGLPLLVPTFSTLIGFLVGSLALHEKSSREWFGRF